MVSDNTNSMHGIELPLRYEIRQITAETGDWCKALAIYGFLLRTSIWTPILREPKTANALRAFEKLSDYYDHSINSSLSYGIFDKEYEYKRPESAATGGALYWDELDPADPYLACKMINAMDFPLVSLALSYDMSSPRTADFEAPLLELIPLNPSLMAHLGIATGVDPIRWLPKKPGELICRTGTITKPGYQRKGLMTVLNRFLMLEMRNRGFKSLTIGTAALEAMSVHRVYTKPPSGCRSTVLHHYDVEAIELTDSDGQKSRPYLGGDLKEGWLVWIDFV